MVCQNNPILSQEISIFSHKDGPILNCLPGQVYSIKAPSAHPCGMGHSGPEILSTASGRVPELIPFIEMLREGDVSEYCPPSPDPDSFEAMA